MTILPRDIARQFWPEFREPILRAEGYEQQWRPVMAAFPHVAVEVLDSTGQLLLGILFEAEDWPHKPPRAIPCSPDFKKRLDAQEARNLAKADDDGSNEKHIWNDPKRPGHGCYFCVEGTRQFHDDYGDALPWESVRHLAEYGPVAIVNNVVDLVNRDSGVIAFGTD